jgi:hypothetical protein
MFFKKILLSILHFIRRIILALKNHCLPLPPPPTPYDMFVKDEIENCYNTFKSHFKKAIFITYKKDYLEYIIQKAVKNDSQNSKLYLEFGVYTGGTINLFSKYVKKIYGFDSFKGLRNDWPGHTDHPEGKFDLNLKLPKLNNNVVPITGWVEDTLDIFLNNNKSEINFVHIDLDTYESTKFVLEKIKPRLSKNCIIAFDEIYNYSGWEAGEYKALIETFNNDEYKYICFCVNGMCAAIQKI